MELKKLTNIKQNKNMSILGNVKVTNGKAHITNLATSIITPCDLPDGLYRWDAWKKDKYILSLESADECPDTPTLNKPEHIGQIDTDGIAHIASIVSDEIKFNLGGIFFVRSCTGENRQLLLSTDGHRLHYSGDIKAKKENGIVISKEVCTILASEPLWLVLRENNNIFFQSFIDKSIVVQRIIDQQYPNYTSVIPKDDTGFTKIGDENLVDFMANFYREVKKTGAKSRNNGFFFSTKDYNFICEQNVPEMADFFSIGPRIEVDIGLIRLALNGSYVNDIDAVHGKKTVLYKDNESVFYVKTEHGGCLVMPLHI